MDLPSLAITSSDDANLNNLRLGLNTTTTLFGDETVGNEARPGGRVSLGMWLDDCETCGVEGRFYALGRQTISSSVHIRRNGASGSTIHQHHPGSR